MCLDAKYGGSSDEYRMNSIQIFFGLISFWWNIRINSSIPATQLALSSAHGSQ